MWVKALVVILFLANIVALAFALSSMLGDQGEPTGRTAHFLTIRIILAVALLAVIVIGLQTGHLGASAPWLTYEK